MTPTRDAAMRLVALALGAAIAIAGLYAVAVRTELGQRYDDRALIGALITEGAAVQQFEHALRTLALPALALGTVLLALLALQRGGAPLALAVGGVLVGANLSAQVMKEVLERPVHVWGPLQEPSFPSGHAMVPISLACALMLILRPGDRLFAALLAIPVAVASGVGVVAFAWHRPSDSIASALVAVTWTAAAAAALALMGRVAVVPRTGGWWTRSRQAMVAVTFALTALAALWFGFEMVTAPVYDGVRFGLYNLAGALLIALAAAGLIGALGYAMRDLDFTARGSLGRERVPERPHGTAALPDVTLRARG